MPRECKSVMIMKVLFICKGNYFRSQMAEAIYNKLTNSEDAYSVGTYVGAADEPEGQVLADLMSLNFFAVMERHGLFIQDKRTKRLLPEMLHEYDVVVSMAEEPFIPDFLKRDSKVICWDVENACGPTFQNMEEKFAIIKKLVLDLLRRYNVEISQEMTGDDKLLS